MTGLPILGLGAIAGFTIFLGLPLGRLQRGGRRTKTFLSGLSAGVLVFLFFDILEHAIQPLEEAVEHQHFADISALAAVFVLGFGGGLLSLVALSRLWRGQPGPPVSIGPGAMAIGEREVAHLHAQRLGMSIAAGIGLHNFSEGLAIGQAASADKISLALLLVIGFALHNATEGFGIVGPFALTETRATWGWLFIAGVVGGGPTFLGTLVGSTLTSEYVFVAFLALAAGAILYVVAELFAAGRRLSWDLTLTGILVGFLLGLGTDLLLEAVGG